MCVCMCVCVCVCVCNRVDLVLHSGDIVDLSMDNMDVAADVEEQRRAQVGDVISKLSTCGKGAPVYYIPGNVRLVLHESHDTLCCSHPHCFPLLCFYYQH